MCIFVCVCVILVEYAEEYRCTAMSHALVHRFVIHWSYRNCDPPPSSSSPPFLLFLVHSTPKTPSILSWGLLTALFVVRKFFPQACAQFWCSKQPFLLSLWCCGNCIQRKISERILTSLILLSTVAQLFRTGPLLHFCALSWRELARHSLKPVKSYQSDKSGVPFIFQSQRLVPGQREKK